jgi:ParB family chromosome partitioning protein
MDKRPALGKGLSALIPDAPPPPRPAPLDADIDLLAPNDLQPRGSVDEARLQELAQSIRANGLIQPIVVRKTGDRFQIIAGERRWRAAKLAGLLRVPIVVRDVVEGEKSQLELALVENIQREDLNPLDEAHAYKRLADQFQLTQEQIAAAVGKDRATVANHLRLLRLPEEVRSEVASGRLSMGHARALLSLAGEAEQRQLARDVVARSLSVRETESLVKKIVEGGSASREAAPAPPVDVHTRAAEERLRILLGTRVRIVRHGTRGRIEIDFTSEEELIRIYDALTER